MNNNQPSLAECIFAIVLIILASIEVFPDSIQPINSDTEITKDK